MIDLGKWASEDYRLSQPGHDELVDYEKLERESEDEHDYVH